MITFFPLILKLNCNYLAINLQVSDFQLSDEDMKVIESFNRPWRACIPMIEVSNIVFSISQTIC